MKLITAILLCAATCAYSVAQATPVIGDQVFFEGTFDQQPYTIKRDLVAYDPSTQTYKQELDVRWEFTIPYHTVVTPASEYISEEKAALIVQNCVSDKGVLETLTVKAGTFLACKKALSNRPEQINWYAPVPCGGIVKIDWMVSPGKRMEIELSTFTKGH